MKSDQEWQHCLNPNVYRILREHGTEPPGSSPLDKVYAPGAYVCAGCESVLFTSETKFDSGTGWPSFFQPVQDAIETSTDDRFGMKRAEVHCRHCQGHLGHVFEDGPLPTGLRYCINGLALKFIPQNSIKK